jgi:hypothetical protein
MSPEEYRRCAAECLRIVAKITDIQDRASLIAAAQAWMQLALQGEKNTRTTLVYETPDAP